MIKATAPGKLVIMGEYAVLYGQAAVVAAVGVRAVCTRQQGPLELERDAGGLVDACLAVAGDVDGRIAVDTSAFRAGNDKYGLGSSAAACVALLRALLPDIQLDELHALAQKAHRGFQRGRGSGIDVCASVFGGFQRYVRRVEGPALISSDVRALRPLPGGVTLLPAWTGVSADTRTYLRQIETVADVAPLMDALGAASEAFQRANTAPELFAAIDDARAGLALLGQRANCDIVSKVHVTLAEIARRHGGAGKPSGAGGGDVSLCFVPDDAADAARAAVRAAGFTVLPLALGAPGVDVVLAAA